MTKLFYPKCPKCNKWTVKAANYCHHCASPLGCDVFESASPTITTKATRPATRQDHRSFLAEAATITTLAIGSVYSLASDYHILSIALSIPLIVYVAPKLGPTITASLLDIKQIVTSPRPKPKHQTFTLEHVDEYVRPRLIADLDARIQPLHLAWIGQQIAVGRSFSRLALCKPGKLSQGQYNLIKADFIKYHYVIPRDYQSPNLGVILTERGKRLVKRMSLEYGADLG